MATYPQTDSPPAWQPRQAEVASSEPGYWLLFDARGEIGFCSDLLAELLGRESAEVRGTAITSILGKLPLRRGTPGANVAAMTMHYVGRQEPLELMVGEGRSLPVNALISSTQLASGPAFIVEIRPREWPDGRCSDSR